MITTRATQLGEDISRLAVQLQHDLDEPNSRKPAYSDIREMRRSLNTLEQELRDEVSSPVGEAC